MFPPVGAFILYLYYFKYFNACVFNFSWTNYTYFKLEALYFVLFFFFIYNHYRVLYNTLYYNMYYTRHIIL